MACLPQEASGGPTRKDSLANLPRPAGLCLLVVACAAYDDYSWPRQAGGPFRLASPPAEALISRKSAAGTPQSCNELPTYLFISRRRRQP